MNHPPPRWQFHTFLVSDLNPLALLALVILFAVVLAVARWRRWT